MRKTSHLQISDLARTLMKSINCSVFFPFLAILYGVGFFRRSQQLDLLYYTKQYKPIHIESRAQKEAVVQSVVISNSYMFRIWCSNSVQMEADMICKRNVKATQGRIPQGNHSFDAGNRRCYGVVYQGRDIFHSANGRPCIFK